MPTLMLAERIVGHAPWHQMATVLVVDDEDGIRDLLSMWITVMGHHAIVAGSADEALAIIRSVPVHVAICDILMPHHDGFWLISHLRRDYPETSIVIATGLDEIDPRVTLCSGIAAYIMKPFQQDTFAIALKVALAMQTVSR